MKVSILIKGNSKNKALADRLVDLLKKAGHEVFKQTTKNANDHYGLLDELLALSPDILIAAGGDGTLHQCLNAIMHKNINKQIKLAHFPIGTANDFARSSHQSNIPEDLITKLNNKQFTPMDIGQITLSSTQKTHYFINIADAGIGGEIIHSVNKGNKNIGGIKYSLSIMKGLVTFKRKEVMIKLDSETYNGKLLSLVMANGNYFANGMNIAPHARLNNGKLAITLFGNVNLYDYFRNISRIKKGKRVNHPEVKYLESTSIEILTPMGYHSHLEADGEYIGTSPAIITPLPTAIEFLM